MLVDELYPDKIGKIVSPFRYMGTIAKYNKEVPKAIKQLDVEYRKSEKLIKTERVNLICYTTEEDLRRSDETGTLTLQCYLLCDPRVPGFPDRDTQILLWKTGMQRLSQACRASGIELAWSGKPMQDPTLSMYHDEIVLQRDTDGNVPNVLKSSIESCALDHGCTPSQAEKHVKIYEEYNKIAEPIYFPEEFIIAHFGVKDLYDLTEDNLDTILEAISTNGILKK